MLLARLELAITLENYREFKPLQKQLSVSFLFLQWLKLATMLENYREFEPHQEHLSISFFVLAMEQTRYLVRKRLRVRAIGRRKKKLTIASCNRRSFFSSLLFSLCSFPSSIFMFALYPTWEPLHRLNMLHLNNTKNWPRKSHNPSQPQETS